MKYYAEWGDFDLWNIETTQMRSELPSLLNIFIHNNSYKRVTSFHLGVSLRSAKMWEGQTCGPWWNLSWAIAFMVNRRWRTVQMRITKIGFFTVRIGRQYVSRPRAHHYNWVSGTPKARCGRCYYTWKATSIWMSDASNEEMELIRHS